MTGPDPCPELIAAAGAAEHLPELGEQLAEIGDVEVAASRAERVGAAVFVAGVGILSALVAVGVVSGREAERQVSHTVNGTHRRPAARARCHAVGERGWEDDPVLLAA